jgi:hypothetical protein
VNTGTIQLKRKTTPILKYDYTYWSSPVANQSLYNTSPKTLSGKFYSFNSSSDNWLVEAPSKIMVAAKGYIIRGPQSFSIATRAVYEASFKGVPNNGEKTIALGPISSFNLIGNPYPSAIDLDVFLKENAAVLKGTIYLWTHNTPLTKNAYTSDDYAVYNLLGGVGTSSSKNVGVNNFRPDGKVASGQSFFVAAASIGGKAKFNNKMRLVGQNTNFFKMNSAQKQKGFASVEKHRAWLNMYSADGVFKQMLVGYMTGATDAYDPFLDGTTFSTNKYLDFYSICEEKNLVIQAKGLPFNDQDEITLGYKTTMDGNYTIDIDEVDGVLKKQEIYIFDKVNKSTHNLKQSPYHFFTQKGTYDTRFVLRYTIGNLGAYDFERTGNGVLIFKEKKELKIKSGSENIKQVVIFDMLGKKVFEKEAINDTVFQASIAFLKDQIGIVKVSLTNGEVISKKVIF